MPGTGAAVETENAMSLSPAKVKGISSPSVTALPSTYRVPVMSDTVRVKLVSLPVITPILRVERSLVTKT